MNRQKKLLSVFLILALVVLEFSLSVYAEAETGGNSSGTFSWIELDSEGHPLPGQISSESNEASSIPPSTSAIPSSSELSSSSSKAPVKTVYESSEFSSGGDESSSELSSMEGVGGLSGTYSSSISLPSVGSIPENNPLSSAVVNQKATRKMNWIGVVSWACILLGVLVILIVVLSNRRPPRGMGRSRYHRPKRSSKKRLLNEKYYRHINR